MPVPPVDEHVTVTVLPKTIDVEDIFDVLASELSPVTLTVKVFSFVSPLLSFAVTAIV